MTDSQQLLTDFIRNGSESAFRGLVARYTDLVYSAAVRLMAGDSHLAQDVTQTVFIDRYTDLVYSAAVRLMAGDLHLAQDVTQTVFIDLARMAPRLSSDVMLGGWLHRHTCFVAATLRRGERRRQSRERQAVEMNALDDGSQPTLAPIAAILDEAINELGTEDREAIALRFFEQSDFRSLGECLGIKENTARMRVTRALEKLHVLLKNRGVTFPAVALGTVLGSEAVTAAPAGLAATLSAAALANLAANPGTALTLLKILTMTKIKTGVLGAFLIAAVTTPIVIHHQAQAKLRERDAALQLQSEQLTQLAAENTRLSNLVVQATLIAEGDSSKELLKLRGEVGVLKRQLATAVNLQENTKRTAQAKTQADSAEEQKQIAIGKMNYTKGWTIAFAQYAYQNEGLLPTNFDQAVSFLPEETKAQTNLAPEQFEITYQGSLKDLTNSQSIIVIREKDAVQSLDGGWHRAYGFADGHSEIHKAIDGNFQPWEMQHMIPSSTDSGAR